MWSKELSSQLLSLMKGLFYSRCLYKDLLQRKAVQQSFTVAFNRETLSSLFCLGQQWYTVALFTEKHCLLCPAHEPHFPNSHQSQLTNVDIDQLRPRNYLPTYLRCCIKQYLQINNSPEPVIYFMKIWVRWQPEVNQFLRTPFPPIDRFQQKAKLPTYTRVIRHMAMQ